MEVASANVSAVTTTSHSSSTSESLIAKLTEEIHSLQAQLAASLRPQMETQSQHNHDPPSSSATSSSVLSSLWRPQKQELQPPQQQQPQEQPDVLSTTSLPTGQMLQPPTMAPVQTTTATTTTTVSNTGNNEQNQLQSIIGPDQPSNDPGLESSVANGFLQGLSAVSINSSSSQHTNGVSQSSESAQTSIQSVQSTLESTVPNVVSNIFSNIQYLAIQTEHNSNASSSGSSQQTNTLTSIDGSSVHLESNETADEITAQGEQLFLEWIDRQIQALHMTASMAAYIRKSALNLFRRIVKQYVQRIGKLGGGVEANVRKATQVALNNTQNLIAFLLRNYLNVAGGLMQIIGEQVSRVGKQLDSTGETIAHINLNPFDIVSNVIASLPNPSRYSEYFRAFGRYLMGETQQVGGNAEQQQQQQQQNDNQDGRRKGLLSKTMGALGKTLGSWLG